MRYDKIKLTGEYVDENGNVTKIDSTKEVKINWESKELSEEEKLKKIVFRKCKLNK